MAAYIILPIIDVTINPPDNSRIIICALSSIATRVAPIYDIPANTIPRIILKIVLPDHSYLKTFILYVNKLIILFSGTNVIYYSDSRASHPLHSRLLSNFIMHVEGVNAMNRT